jgi:hypothetical protein
MTVSEYSVPTYIDKIDVNASGVTYFGVAVAGSATSAAVWQIQAKSVSGVVTTFTWADGNMNHDNIWDNRASLSYS